MPNFLIAPEARHRRTPCGAARVASLSFLLGVLALGLGACTTTLPPTASFSVSAEYAEADLERMAATPAALQRPLVVLAGYRSPRFFAQALADKLRRLTGADASDILVVGYPGAGDIPQAARLVVDEVNLRWPSADLGETTEVDVVAISMGGLVARLCASDAPIPASAYSGSAAAPPSKRLRIRRLFTLATPHQGAKLAETIALDPAAVDMKPGSAFLEALNAQLGRADYQLVCYARTHDDIVGATRAAPPGAVPLWLPGPLFFSHQTIQDDPRLAADIARRLRGEEPLATPLGGPPED